MKALNGRALPPINQEQAHNLFRLALYHLREIDLCPVGFDMTTYTTLAGDRGRPHKLATETACGSVGCLVGHGPLAGIPAQLGEEWWDYSARVFCRPESAAYWDWMFNHTWCMSDNTPRGGALRILWLLANGLPKKHAAQRQGRSPPRYSDWSPPWRQFQRAGYKVPEDLLLEEQPERPPEVAARAHAESVLVTAQ